MNKFNPVIIILTPNTRSSYTKVLKLPFTNDMHHWLLCTSRCDKNSQVCTSVHSSLGYLNDKKTQLGTSFHPVSTTVSGVTPTAAAFNSSLTYQPARHTEL